MRVSSFSQIYILVGLVLALQTIQSMDAAAQDANSQIFIVDSDSSEFVFKVAHFGMFDVNGSFQEASGFIEVDMSRELPVRAEIELRVESINTDDDTRDQNLRSDEFLDAERFPVVRFESFTIRKPESTGENLDQKSHIEGQMTIFGAKRNLQFPFTFEIRDEIKPATVYIHAEFKLSRDDFNLSFGRLMDAMVGDEISVRVRIVARAQA